MLDFLTSRRDGGGGGGEETYDEENDSVGPCTVDVIDQGDVCVVELVAGDFVWVAVVVAAHLDHDEVGRLFGFVVEFLWLVAEECVGTTARVGGAIPVPCLFDGL